MNKQISRLGVILLVGYLALFVQLNNLTIFGAERLRENPINQREIRRDFDAPRGFIATADGTIIAQTLDVDDPNARFSTQRVYPEGELYAHLAGYFSFQLGSTGLESQYNGELAGRGMEFDFQSIEDLFVEQDRVGNLTTTLVHDVQATAREALGERLGSVVAIDPRTGAVLASWSWPSYDPNLLADHDFAAAQAARAALIPPDGSGLPRPLLAKAYQDRFAPGSTFKVVTGSAGVESGTVGPTEPQYPVSREYTPPQTSNPITNFGGSICGGDLVESLRVSCNTSFAQMAVDLGADAMIATAEDYGFNQVPPLDLPGVASSRYPTDFSNNIPALAQTGIGQNDVSATPLQMALVTAGIANDGIVMAPYVVDRVVDTEGTEISRHTPSQWRNAVAPETARIIRDAMVVTATQGTATSIQLPGFEVGGKTGSAQTGRGTTHAWMIGYAGVPGETPSVAVAVIVEGTEENPDQTGGSTAGPIARAVLEAALAAQG